ncbi:TIGR02679 family protein [Fundicoccus culcitae]|uniref:TIGR02679 family protein n=1 Tax=Fundicoccus culcitae TaxID=2969821 RepID=A0ABY5P3M3_9LACT|nr:TIGR02679 family protein [Fundicoccus culcitae]UUX33164.1 TIGR02679 family protein [Fundicoccus culcitae]
MKNNDKLVMEAAAYFKERPGFQRLFKAMRRRYQALGRIGGNVHIQHLTQVEKETLGTYLQRSLMHQQSVTISLTSFERQLAATRFASISLLDLLEAYFEGEIITHKMQAKHVVNERQIAIERWKEQATAGLGKDWLVMQLEHDSTMRRYLFNKYKQNKVTWLTHLFHLTNAMNALLSNQQNPPIKIALFATTITGNPHAFDIGQELERWLVFALATFKGLDHSKLNGESKGELLFEFGLVRDSLYNFTFAYQLQGYDRNRQEHPGMKGYNELDEPQVVTLETLSNIQVLESIDQVVYIVENPTVLSTLVSYFVNSQAQKHTLISTNGQLNQSSLMLLDLLAQKGCQMFYAGDFDPEGLLIAERLKQRYQQQLQFWRLTLSDYEACLSNETISEHRLKKLHRLSQPELIVLADRMREIKKAGYQERLVDFYLKDLRG